MIRFQKQTSFFLSISTSVFFFIFCSVLFFKTTLATPSKDNYTFSFVSGEGDTDNTFFGFDNTKKQQLILKKKLNHREKSEYSIRVRIDNGIDSIEKIFRIPVKDASKTSLKNEYKFSLISGEGDTDNDFFEFDNTKKQKLILKNELDYEEKSEYSIRVGIDNGVDFIEKIFLIPIENKNEPILDLVLETNAITEDLPPKSTISTLSVIDTDNTGVYTYSLVDELDSDQNIIPNDNSNFYIEAGALKNLAPFNFEEKSKYNIRIKVSDKDFDFEKNFALSIINVNEAPTDLKLISPNMTTSEIIVAEGENAGQLVGNIIAHDDDGDDLNYSIIYGQGDSFFKIEEGNKLKTKIVFDSAQQNIYQVGIRASDGNLEIIKTFDIIAKNVNRPPALLSLDNITIDENTVGKVGAFIVQDNDDTKFKFEFISGTGDQNNDLFEIKNNSELHTKSGIDFEENSVLSVRIKTIDSAQNELEETFVIYLNDTSEHCDKLISSECSALMNLYDSLGGTEENLNWKDPQIDHWKGVKFTPLLVKINGAKRIQNHVTEIKAPNFELLGKIPETIGNLSQLKTLDLSNNKISGNLPQSLGNLENLEVLNLSNNQIDEVIPESFGNLKSLKTLALSHNKISGSFPDTLGNLENLEYLFVFQNNLSCQIPQSFMNLKNIKENYGLRIHQNNLLIDEDNLDLYNFLFKKSYKGNQDFSSQKSPRCGNIPSDITLSDYTIEENNSSSQVIGDLSTADLDPDSTFEYSLTFGDGVVDNNYFIIEDGQLLANEVFDFEKKSLYNIRIKSSDGFNTISKNLKVKILDQDLPIREIQLNEDFFLDHYFAGQKITEILIEDDGESPVEFIIPEAISKYITIKDQVLFARQNFDLKGKKELQFSLMAKDKNSKFEKGFKIKIEKDSDNDGTPDRDEDKGELSNSCLPDPLSQACLVLDKDQDGLPNLADSDPSDPCNPDASNQACKNKWGDLYDSVYDGSLSIGIPVEIDPEALPEEDSAPPLGGVSVSIGSHNNNCGTKCQKTKKKNEDYNIKLLDQDQTEENYNSKIIFKIGDHLDFILPSNQPKGDYYINLKPLGLNKNLKLGEPLILKEGKINGKSISFSVQGVDKNGRVINTFNIRPIKIDNVPPPLYGDVGSLSGGTGANGAFLEGDTLTYTAPITNDRFELDLGKLESSKFLQTGESFVLKNISNLYGKSQKTFVTAIDPAGNKRTFAGPTIWFGSVGTEENESQNANLNNKVLDALKKLKQEQLDKKSRSNKKFNPYNY